MAQYLTAALIRKVREHIRRGGVIAYPTESCYGLGCDPRNRNAVKKLLAIKGRPQAKGLILVAADFQQLRCYASPLTPEQWLRISPTWPGPVTWLLPAAAKTPAWLRGSHQSVAVRVTAHAQASRLCRVLGMALVSTSANRSGMKPAKTFAAGARAFGREALVLPGLIGKCKRPSAIIDLIGGFRVR